MNVFEKIEAQQKGKEYTAPWMVGEQLKEICRREPHAAELVDKDLDVKEMSLEACEKKIKAWADAHKKGASACVPPNVAEDIIREFYGIPSPHQSASQTASPQGEAFGGDEIIDFADLL